VIVEESQGDRRSILIQLSAKTLSLEEKFNRATKRITDIFYRGFDEEKATELDRLLNIIKENLKNE
ncbi:MAG: hypothetical protein II088_07740, partial [Bacteroidales bacterium]|nr:hypothetical protein [Bacteroidales bacterium]